MGISNPGSLKDLHPLKSQTGVSTQFYGIRLMPLISYFIIFDGANEKGC